MTRFESYIFPLTSIIAFVMVVIFVLTLGGRAESQLIVKNNEQQGVFFGDTVVLSAGVASAIATDGLVAYWSFDEEEGVVVSDRSGNKNNGVLKGSPTRVAGKQGGALFFDGVDDYVFIVDRDVIGIQKTFTLTAWVKGESSATGVMLNEGVYALALNNKNLVWSVQGRTSISTGKLSEGDEWTHVAIVVDALLSPSTRLYINGAHVLSSSIPSIENQDVHFLIGRDGEGNYFNGSIDEVRVYDYALSKGEIKSLSER